MWIKNDVRHLVWCLFFFSVLCLCAWRMSAAGPEPPPPFQKSAIGYLYVPHDVGVTPLDDRIQIAPFSTLTCLENRKDGALCAVAYKKNIVAVLLTPLIYDKKMEVGTTLRLRNSVAMRQLPFPLKAMSELPVTAESVDSRTVLYRWNGTVFSLEVGRDQQGVTFSKQSRLGQFEEQQRENGMVRYRGRWITLDEERMLRQTEQSKKQAKTQKLDQVRETAKMGFIFLADGRTLEGVYRGADPQSVLFETGTPPEIKRFALSDIQYFSREEAMSRAWLSKARVRIDRASAALTEHGYGDCARVLDELEGVIADIPAGTRANGDNLDRVKADYTALRGNLQHTLQAAGLELYQYQAFPKYVLQNHLSAGHLLFRGKVWISRSQLCARCTGHGTLKCLDCQGAGRIVTPCPHCNGAGTFPCELCGGTGKRVCPACNGSQKTNEPCTRCHGAGSITVYSSPFVPNFSNNPRGGGSYVIPFNPTPQARDKICPRCGGTGIMPDPCRKCSGRGYFVCPSTQPCNFCKGQGKISRTCEKCEGTGSYACPDCQGAGYLGTPCPDDPSVPGTQVSPVPVPPAPLPQSPVAPVPPGPDAVSPAESGR